MDKFFEYYLLGGKLSIGKKELTLEMLRSGSALRILLGHVAGDLKPLASQVHVVTQEDAVTLDFGGMAARKVDGDPAQILNEMKRRCGASVGGTLYFKCVYLPRGHFFTLAARLDEDPVKLMP